MYRVTDSSARDGRKLSEMSGWYCIEFSLGHLSTNDESKRIDRYLSHSSMPPHTTGQDPILEDILSGVNSTVSISCVGGLLEFGVCGGLANDEVRNLNGRFCPKPFLRPTISMLLKYWRHLSAEESNSL